LELSEFCIYIYIYFVFNLNSDFIFTGYINRNRGKLPPETAKNIEEHVAKYGEATMTTTARALNTRDQIKRCTIKLLATRECQV
jgi:hypothetical protein